MVDHDLLHRELARLATRWGPDTDLYNGLHELTLTTSAALDVDGAGITIRMPNGATNFITATDSVTMHVQRRQDQLQEGVCVEAMNTAEVVAVNDLAAEARWPSYTPEVLQAGFHAVAGVPISFEGQRIGAINLYTRLSRAWTTDEFSAAALIADLAAGYLMNRELRRTAEALAAQLQQALDSRVIIEQAKGILAGRHDMTPDAAFEILRGYARSERDKLHRVAAAVVHGTVEVIPKRRAGSSPETSGQTS